MEPTYIEQSEYFLENLASEIPANEAVMWMMLFHLRNKARLKNNNQWPEWFEVSNSALAETMHKDSRNLYKLKQKLRDRGLIDYRQEKKGGPTQYKILLPGAGSVKTTVTVKNTHNPRKNNGRGRVFSTVRKYATSEPGNVGTQGAADVLREEEYKRDRESKLKTKVFHPPTVEEVRKYVAEKGLSIDPQRFVDYYEAGDWHDSKGKAVKNWKQRAITWDKHNDKSPYHETTREEREAERLAQAAAEEAYMRRRAADGRT